MGSPSASRGSSKARRRRSSGPISRADLPAAKINPIVTEAGNMPLSVNTNVAAVRSLGALHATQASMATSLTRLSTGLRINSGKDDPTGLIAVTALSKELVEIDSHIDADQRAYFDSAITEGKLAQKSNMLLELKSLAVSSANAAGLSPDEKQANQLEVDSILSGLARLSGTSLQAPQQIDPQDFSHHSFN